MKKIDYMIMMSEKLLKVEELRKYFYERTGRISDALKGRKKILKALDGINFELAQAESLGVVGESGCGKTTMVRTIIRLYEPISGKITFKGRDITHLNDKEIRPIRKKIQMIYQNPYTSLNPRRKIRDIIIEPLIAHNIEIDKEETIKALLSQVGLDEDFSLKYPHQLSGGQRQRVAIARAIALKPELVIADEVSTALDVSIQSQILNLLKDLQKQHNIAFLIISHDLSIIRHMAHRILIMYLGIIVEEGYVKDIYDNPSHPYVQALLSSIPTLDMENVWKPVHLGGEPSSAAEIPAGCRFHPRCPYALNKCSENNPTLIDVEKNHRAACFLLEKK